MLCAFGGRRDPPGHARCFSPGRWPAVIPGVRVIRPCGLLWMKGWPPCQRHLRRRARRWPRLTSCSHHPGSRSQAPWYRSTVLLLHRSIVLSLDRCIARLLSAVPAVSALPAVPQTGRCCTATTRGRKKWPWDLRRSQGRFFSFPFRFRARAAMPRAASRSRVV
jgi:hypothetical protein